MTLGIHNIRNDYLVIEYLIWQEDNVHYAYSLNNRSGPQYFLIQQSFGKVSSVRLVIPKRIVGINNIQQCAVCQSALL